MIRAILRANTGLLPAFLIVAIALGAAAWLLAPRWRLARWVAVLFSVSLAGEVTATLYPTGHGSPASDVCSYSKDFLGAFADQQGLLNVVMYVPLAFLGVLLVNRPLIMLTGCWLLSATTETAQALLPEIGRACDSQDFVTNATGALLGVALAVAWRSLRGTFVMPTGREVFRSGMPLAAGMIILLVVQSVAVSPQWAGGGLTKVESSDKRTLAIKDAGLVFGPGTEVVNVQDEAALGQTPEVLIATTRTQQLSIEWPSGQLYSGTVNGLGLPADGGSDAEARNAADAFAHQWFSQDIVAATVRVYKVDPAKGRRTVEYRRFRPDGLLEPMRLDIEVDPGGQIAMFSSRSVADPQLAPVTVSREAAVATVTTAHPGGVQNAFLLAAQVGGEWRPCWAVTVAVSTDTDAKGVSYEVDAATGVMVQSSAQP
ncbi:VanZ family protein [Kitasatospora sp. NBC_01287]|uniref:VanZ family protein n=1 Tax=Kitasatospora sp. NBC_01287 TaxID=2903573 RepID=UPI0022578AC3|nr:VanZ family protein [Kitasatospora sp. NBC_01287]MCX4747321.1 VanZ family protein [Kitasatospora sp. NBC_01287]